MARQYSHLVTSWGMSPFLVGDQQTALLASLIVVFFLHLGSSAP